MEDLMFRNLFSKTSKKPSGKPLSNGDHLFAYLLVIVVLNWLN
jgi:hypothetical protein